MADERKESSDDKRETGVPPVTLAERMGKYEKLRCTELMNRLRTCLSSYNQFHHYYIYGKFTDCALIKDQILLCMKWRTKQLTEAKEELIQSFEEEYKSMHHSDTVWEMRNEPPKNW